MSEEKTPFGQTHLENNEIEDVELSNGADGGEGEDDGETETEENSKSRLRYFAVGPKNRQIQCPVCFRKSSTYEGQTFNAKDQIHTCLSCFSCCFPIFLVSFFILIFSRFTRRKRHFCINCGAEVGFHFRPS